MAKDQFNSISLKKYAEDSYLNYAMYVILDRALMLFKIIIFDIVYSNFTIIF